MSRRKVRISKRGVSRPVDQDLAAWQEWTSHNPGYWMSSGRIPPVSRYGRRPTRAGYVLVVVGVLTLLAGLVQIAVALAAPGARSITWVLLGMSPLLIIGMLLIAAGLR